MASARTTYQDRQGGGAEAAAYPFVWVSLRDPSPEELAAVQREFGLPAPLVDSLATAAAVCPGRGGAAGAARGSRGGSGPRAGRPVLA